MRQLTLSFMNAESSYSPITPIRSSSVTIIDEPNLSVGNQILLDESSYPNKTQEILIPNPLQTTTIAAPNSSAKLCTSVICCF